MRIPSPSVRLALLLAGGMIAGGAAAGATTRPSAKIPAMHGHSDPWGGLLEQTLKKPALVAVTQQVQGLEYWAISPRGSSKPRTITKKLTLGYAALVAKGDIVYAAMENPPQVLAYDIRSGTQGTMPDPFGTPVDIAIGKDSSLYVINSGRGNVAWYPKGSGQAQQLTCKDIYLGEDIAVDNEGDIFLQGYEGRRGSTTGVVEIPNGPSGPQSGACKRLHLIPANTANPAGLAIDPKTDALITLSNPDSCAGGDEGLMTIYLKPYNQNTATSVLLGGDCTGTLRLNADSTLVFYGDQSVSGGFSYIDSSTYPAGKSLGVYSEGGSFGGQGPGGFTTIPNTLPN